MKSNDIDNKKPWENIDIDEIQPYPLKYTKIAALSLLAVFLTIIVDLLITLNIWNNFLAVLTLASFGLIAFFIFNIIFEQWHRKIEPLFIILFFYTFFIAIKEVMGLFKMEKPLFSALAAVNIYSLTDFLYVYLGGFFALIIMGGIAYLFVSNHPRAQKYGVVAVAALAIFFILKIG